MLGLFVLALRPAASAAPSRRLLLSALLAWLCCGATAGLWDLSPVPLVETGAKQDLVPQVDSTLITVALDKQHVPVRKENRTVAHKTAYFGTVHAGYPATQNFSVVFDTGSGHFILPSVACKTETCTKHRRYNRAHSVSAVDIEHDGTPVRQGAAERDQVAINFGTGEVTGEFMDEVVCLHGALAALPAAEAAEPGAALRGHAPGCTRLRSVLAIDMTDDPFQLFQFDGVLGLGLEALALSKEYSFFGQMTRLHPRMQHVFSVYLAHRENDPSEISFGGHNPERLALGATLKWTNVASPELGYWQVPIKGVSIGGEELDLCKSGSCRAILDTGTSLLGVPKQGARAIHWQLARPVDYSPELDCRGFPGPPIVFDMGGGTTVQLDAQDYSRPAPARMLREGATESEIFCRSSLLPVDMKEPLGQNVFIWGEPVLRRYYTAYDWGSKRIGFGPARLEPEGLQI
jgi:hypothetical protein